MVCHARALLCKLDTLIVGIRLLTFRVGPCVFKIAYTVHKLVCRVGRAQTHITDDLHTTLHSYCKALASRVVDYESICHRICSSQWSCNWVCVQACIKDANQALQSCQKIGFPIMLKASWGGGGKGIRKCTNADEVLTAFKQVNAKFQSHLWVLKKWQNFGDIQSYQNVYTFQVPLYHDKIMLWRPLTVLNGPTAILHINQALHIAACTYSCSQTDSSEYLPCNNMKMLEEISDAWLKSVSRCKEKYQALQYLPWNWQPRRAI